MNPSKMSTYNWSHEKILQLINLRHDVDIEMQFDKHKSHAHKIKILWDEIGHKVDGELTGPAAKNKYNYLVQEYRRHHLKSKISGEGAVKWQYYAILKDFLSKNPSIKPTNVVDSQTIALESATSPEPSPSTMEISPDIFDNEFIRPLTAKKHKRSNKIDEILNVFIDNNRKKQELMTTFVNQSNQTPKEIIDLTEEVGAIKQQIQQLDDKVTEIFNFIKNLSQ